MTSPLFDLSAITNETLPLILVLISIILTGNIIRIIYFAKKETILKYCTIKIKDVIVLTAGLTINLLTLYFLNVDYSLKNYNLFYNAKTWLILGITTLVLGFLTWEFRIKGEKWLKDTVIDLFSYILGILLVILSLDSIHKIWLMIWLLSLDNITIFISNIIKIFFLVCLTIFFGYVAVKLLRNKTRRYHLKN